MRIEFKVKDCAVLQDPVYTANRKYVLYVNVKDLPNNIPTLCNPRMQNLGTRVARKIKGTLEDKGKDYFHAINRGITLLATNVKYDSKKKKIGMSFDNLEIHGNIDGGHTYAVITSNKDSLEGENYVAVEVLEGYDNIFTEIAAARNTSVQVTTSSIMELEDKYAIIKTALTGTELEGQVAYKQNDVKPVIVENLIALMYMFDVEKFSNESTEQPCVAAFNKHRTVERYATNLLEDNSIYRQLAHYLPLFISLANAIETSMPEAYNSLSAGRSYFGRTAGITSLKRGGTTRYALYSSTAEVDYVIPKGFLFPIIAAFRFLLTLDEDGELTFKLVGDELNKFVIDLLPRLTDLTVTRIRNNKRNAHSMARDIDHWKNLYTEVEMAYLRRKLK